MEIREAFLKVADLIDADHGRWDFYSGRIPRSATGEACALGWLGFMLGEKSLSNTARRVVGAPHDADSEREFYHCIQAVTIGNNHPTSWYLSECTPAQAATALRRYADRYHPAPFGIPESVRVLFDDVERPVEFA